jgi:hypothetical protein
LTFVLTNSNMGKQKKVGQKNEKYRYLFLDHLKIFQILTKPQI